MKPTSLVFALVIFMFVPAFAADEVAGHANMDHGAVTAAETMPKEPGQSSFAAIQEIVTILDADPETDWSKVDIEALRQHLIDMSNVTLLARVQNATAADGMIFSVSGDGIVKDSIRRMVAGHADAMNGVSNWRYIAEPSSSGANLTVIPPDESSAVKLRALGFIGIMARGMHHQEHHLMIAKGLGPHQ